MRRPGVKSVFYAAIVVAGIATIGAYRALQATRVHDDSKARLVVVASRDVPEGTEVGRDAVQIMRWPTQILPSGAYASIDSVAGRVSRSQIFAGDPVTTSRLAPRGSGGGLEVKITPGKRAMAVPISDVAGFGSLIQPNARVDVLVTLRPELNSMRQVSKLFLENVRVLSVGNRLQRGDDGRPSQASSATLEVTPSEAERLAVAGTQGSIQLVLRGFGDPDSARTSGASTSDILQQLHNAPTVDVAADAPSPRPIARNTEARRAIADVPRVPVASTAGRDSTVIRVYRGTKVEQQTVGRDSARRRP
ncbi:MAG: flp pilus assembly protein [Gemmatimonadetes bacterium]|nr:flp pilus assembly protein [Gemmatimonadota bacterium]